MTYLRCALALFACACQPIVFPRTAEIAKRGAVSLQGGMQVATLDSEKLVDSSGIEQRSNAAFVPDLSLELHVGAGRCELGTVFEDIAALAELRCALVQQDWGDPVSIAFSGAAGASASAGIGFAPSARLGIDVSKRVGSVEPLAGVYLSTSRQAHYIQTGVVDDPVVGPVGVVLGRQEIRLSIPLGVAFVLPDKAHRPLDPTVRSFIVGVEPWFVLASSSHVEVDPVPRTFTPTSWGLSFTLGLSFR